MGGGGSTTAIYRYIERDGTVTITNVGVFGIDGGTPILNPGESAPIELTWSPAVPAGERVITIEDAAEWRDAVKRKFNDIGARRRRVWHSGTAGSPT